MTMNQVISANLIETGRQPQNAQEHAKAKRLYKAYRWTWPMYWALGVKQGWRCAICGRMAKNAPLQVDHRHPKVVCEQIWSKGVKIWVGVSDIEGTRPMYAATKAEAARLAKEEALPLSVRGLLCPGRHFGCNRLLGRIDKPEWLAAALEYVKNPPAKQLDKTPNL